MSKEFNNRKYQPYADDIPYLKLNKNLFLYGDLMNIKNNTRGLDPNLNQNKHNADGEGYLNVSMGSYNYTTPGLPNNNSTISRSIFSNASLQTPKTVLNIVDNTQANLLLIVDLSELILTNSGIKPKTNLLNDINNIGSNVINLASSIGNNASNTVSTASTAANNASNAVLTASNTIASTPSTYSTNGFTNLGNNFASNSGGMKIVESYSGPEVLSNTTMKSINELIAKNVAEEAAKKNNFWTKGTGSKWGDAGIMAGALLAGTIGKSVILDGYENSIGNTGMNYGDAIGAGANIASSILAATGVGVPIAAAVSLAGNLLGGVIDRGFGMKTDLSKVASNMQGDAILRNTRFDANNLDAITDAPNVGVLQDAYENGWFNSKGDRKNAEERALRNYLTAYVGRGITNNASNLLSDQMSNLYRNFKGAEGGRLHLDYNEGDEVDLTPELINELKRLGYDISEI